MKKQAKIEWMQKHSPRYAVLLGLDGYQQSPKFDAFFKKHYTNYFTERITLIVMLLASEESVEVYLNGQEFNLEEKGLTALKSTIREVMIQKKLKLEIIFTRPIEWSYQYMLVIDGLNSTSFYHVPERRKKYLKKLVNRHNLTLKYVPRNTGLN